MQRYLLFDSGCTMCVDVARAIEQTSNGWMQARSLSDPEMQALLVKARPNWKWEPTLLEVDGQKVKVFTGGRLRAKIGFGLGLRRAWRIVQHLSEARPVVYEGRLFTSARRTFFKQMSMAAGVLVLPASAHSASRIGGLGSSALLWERLSPTESTSLVAATRSSDPYQSFTTRLAPQFVVGEGAGVFGRGDIAFVAVPITCQNKANGSAFAAVVDRKFQQVNQTMAWTIEDADGLHHAQVQLNGQAILDATFDNNGTVVSGWVRDAKGGTQSIVGQNTVAEGRKALDDLRRSLQTHGDGITTQQSSFDCLNACLSSAGLPLYLLALIGVVCAIACAITAGFGCFACLSGLLGGLLGTGLRCLVNCGYAVP